MIKNMIDIRDEFFDNGKLSAQSMKDLIWHIENDPEPGRAISLVTDARFMELVPLAAKHLNNEDEYIREFTVGCLVGRLALSKYTAKAFDMAQNDSDDGVRGAAIKSLGVVINKVDATLKKQIAVFIYNVIFEFNSKYDNLDKRSAFDSILEAMDITVPERISTPYDENHELVKQFKIKYGI